MVKNDTKTYQNTRRIRKKLVEYRKKYVKQTNKKKTPDCNYKKLILFRKIVFFLEREKLCFFLG